MTFGVSRRANSARYALPGVTQAACAHIQATAGSFCPMKIASSKSKTTRGFRERSLFSKTMPRPARSRLTKTASNRPACDTSRHRFHFICDAAEPVVRRADPAPRKAGCDHWRSGTFGRWSTVHPALSRPGMNWMNRTRLAGSNALFVIPRTLGITGLPSGGPRAP